MRFNTSSDPIRAAADIRRRLGLQEIDPLDMVQALSKLGIEYEFVDTSEFRVRTAYTDPDILGRESFKMEISKNLSPEMTRFAIAHAIGHLCLHKQQDRVFLDKNFSKQNPFEIEANKFAAELLLPLKTYAPTLRSYKFDENKIGKLANVPAGAAKLQIVRLFAGR